MAVSAAIDITPTERKTILALLGRFLPGVEVWAHGSRVKWTSRPDSDLDLVAFARPQQSHAVSELREAFDQSSLSFRVDLAVWDEIPERFRRNIEKEHAVVACGAAEEVAGGWKMAAEWQDTILGEFVVLQRGHDLTEPERRNGNVPVMGSAGQNGFHDTALAKGPGVVIGRSGASFGQVHYIQVDYWPHNTTLYVTDFKGNDPRFAFYFLKAIDFSRYNSGSAQQSLNRNFIYPIAVRVPPLPEQRAVAAALGALDDKIESNRRASRALERVARAIFRAWFVDFEPVKAKAAGARSFPGMPQKAFNALPTRLVESELGPIPEGWGVGTIADIADLSRAAVDPQEHSEELFEHLSIPAFDDSKRPVLEFGGAIKSNKLAVTAECVLVSKLNPRTPRVWLPPKPGHLRQIASTEFMVTVPKSEWHRSYLFCLVQQQEFVEDMAQRASGTSNSHQRVKPADYLGTGAVLPTRSVREAFEDIAWPLLELSQSMFRQTGKLAAMRDYLLPKLLSGEVRVAADSVCASLAPAAASRQRRRGHE